MTDSHVPKKPTKNGCTGMVKIKVIPNGVKLREYLNQIIFECGGRGKNLVKMKHFKVVHNGLK